MKTGIKALLIAVPLGTVIALLIYEAILFIQSATEEQLVLLAKVAYLLLMIFIVWMWTYIMIDNRGEW